MFTKVYPRLHFRKWPQLKFNFFFVRSAKLNFNTLLLLVPSWKIKSHWIENAFVFTKSEISSLHLPRVRGSARQTNSQTVNSQHDSWRHFLSQKTFIFISMKKELHDNIRK